MIANKHLSKIIIALMAVAVALCILAIIFSDDLVAALGGTGVTMEYESALFDTSEIIEINIIMDEENWNTMLANSTSEEYYVCDVVVNGKKFKNVAIRPKGNTSLSAIAMDTTTDRYSFKLEFDHYIESQTCYGLDKLILNNNYADATNMKEAIIYDMFQYLGADASLYNYAKVSVNGEYWGVYLALEAVEDSFMVRNYGSQDGELYKPESLGMGGGGGNAAGGNIDFSDVIGNFGGQTAPGTPDVTAGPDASGETPGAGLDMGNFDMSNIDMSQFGGGAGGASTGGGGADLNYTDDDLDSYSTIWESAITGTTKSDYRRVVTALKNISEGNELEKYLDIDNLLKYMAVHVFAVNMDSLSGSMAHNYYIYEYKGQLNIIPWDYNLSFGGLTMSAGSASSMINDAIDTPFDGTDFFDKILENEEYAAKYHEYLQQLVDEYIYGGKFEETYNRIRSQIDALVETDPTAFYTYEEYLAAIDMFCKTLNLRAASIDGQLNGSIPSTDAGQKDNAASLIDASEINIEVMGQFNMMGMLNGNMNDFTGGGSDPSGEGASGDNPENSPGNSSGNAQENADSWGSGGNMDFSGSQGNTSNPAVSGTPDSGGMPNISGTPDSGSMPNISGMPDSGGMPGGNVDFSSFAGAGGMSGMPGGAGQAVNKIQTAISFLACFIAMLGAYFIIKKISRR